MHEPHPYFWKSLVDKPGTADAIKENLFEIIEELHELEIKVACVIADNAAAIQKAIRNCPLVMPLQYGAHTFNLMVREVFKSVEYAKNFLVILDRLVSEGSLRRYFDARWNSRFDKLKKRKAHVTDDEKRLFERTIHLLEPLILLLNYVQSDNATSIEVLKRYEKAIGEAENPIFIECCRKHYPKLNNCQNYQLFESGFQSFRDRQNLD